MEAPAHESRLLNLSFGANGLSEFWTVYWTANQELAASAEA